MFIDGRSMIYLIANENDSIIDELNCRNCNNTMMSPSGSDLNLYYCFATDQLIGDLTLLCIFIPGLLMVGFIYISWDFLSSKDTTE